MKSQAILKDRVKTLVYKMFINELEFRRLFKGILKVVFSFFSVVLTYMVIQRIFLRRM